MLYSYIHVSNMQPLFIALCQMWTGFQDEVVLLSVLSNLLSTMSVFTKVFYLYYGICTNMTCNLIYIRNNNTRMFLNLIRFNFRQPNLGNLYDSLAESMANTSSGCVTRFRPCYLSADSEAGHGRVYIFVADSAMIIHKQQLGIHASYKQRWVGVDLLPTQQ